MTTTTSSSSSPSVITTATGTSGEVEQAVVRLAAVVERLSAQVADRLTPKTPVGGGVVQVSWLVLPADPTAARTLLDGLIGWLARVFLRYTDAVRAVPECWLWHPDVIEELLWCHHAWLHAYGPDGSPARVGEWHTSHRPGVVARVKTLAGMCSIETHQPRRVDPHTTSSAVPFADSAAVIADWWATGRDRPPPHAPAPVRVGGQNHTTTENEHERGKDL